ncbi:MAG: hypothetical protein O3A81_02615, partial [bacterium]|nr:hypothetical protein [bacterium]
MDKPNYGFTGFLDCSDDPELFRTMENSELPIPFALIQERTQIERRQIVRPGVNITALARSAMRQIFEKLNITGRDCAGVVLSSCSAGNESDSLSKLAARTGATHGIPFSRSLNYACSGFPAAVQTAQEMDNPSGRHIIIITAETMSRIVDWSEENTAVVFGDGVAVTSIIPGGKHEIYEASAKGNIDDPNNCLQFGLKEGTLTVDGDSDPSARLTISMSMRGGRYLYKKVPTALVDIVDDYANGLEAFAHIVPHQANGKFIEKMREIIAERQPSSVPHLVGTIQTHANTASASIPKALAASIDSFSPGDLIGCPAKGAGINFEEG